MLKLFVPLICLCSCTVWAMSGQDGAPAAKAAVSPEETAVKDVLKVYADVYNKHDAGKLIEYWTPNAVSLNTETGSRITGRDAIKAGFEQLFKADPKSQLTIRLKHYRFIKPDLLSIEGESVVTSPNQEPAENTFTALLVKVGDIWQIEQATESSVPTPATPYDGLKSLEWMVGNWADETPGVTVESQISWNAKKTFLIRKYSVQFDNETEVETGSQVIAWDARSKTIRSWTFSSDGSFGEGAWSNNDNEWRVKFNHTGSDGSVTSGTQVINKVNDRTASVQIVGQEVDGQLTPTRPAVKMVKKEATSSSEPK